MKYLVLAESTSKLTNKYLFTKAQVAILIIAQVLTWTRPLTKAKHKKFGEKSTLYIETQLA